MLLRVMSRSWALDEVLKGTLVVAAQAVSGNRNGDLRGATTRRDSHTSHLDSHLYTTDHGITKVRFFWTGHSNSTRASRATALAITTRMGRSAQLSSFRPRLRAASL